MKSSATCPNCDKSFRIDRDKEGKRAKCPKCEKLFVIEFVNGLSEADDLDSIDYLASPAASKFPPIVSKIQKPAAEPLPEKSKFAMPQWAIVAVASLATLAIGYFAGREHLKYQLRTAISDVASAFSGSFNAPPDAKPILSTSGSIETEPQSEPIPKLDLGQTYNGDGFDVTLTKAAIDSPDVKDMMGDIGKSTNPNLVLTFIFENTDERKILRFKEDNQFMASQFQLRDDVDNVIRGVSFGLSSKVVGALTGNEDILPGSQVSHVEVFSIPPPKTEHLVLTVNTECLGGDNAIEFTIPANLIEKK